MILIFKAWPHEKIMKAVRYDKKRVGVAGAAVSRGLRFNSGDWKAILPCGGWRACPPAPDSGAATPEAS